MESPGHASFPPTSLDRQDNEEVTSEKCRLHMKQLAARWSTATGVLISASSTRRRLLHCALRARVPLYRIALTANHRRLRLHWAHEHRAWQADWHQVVFSHESRFNFWDHEGHIRVRRYAAEICFAECVIERHSGLTPGLNSQ
ncbi:HTH_Tnp_Tc3_2 domain-containing protein [Trichonephila clavipes]|nr:HTH_Tnp_Tc3_2 domain-containing protein [Trichonephila clavipes]